MIFKSKPFVFASIAFIGVVSVVVAYRSFFNNKFHSPVAEVKLTPTMEVIATATPVPSPSPTSAPSQTQPTDSNSSPTWYVSPSGNDSNSGKSKDSPFKNIQKAVDIANPGDTIELKSGVYIQDFVSKKDGSKDAPITINGPADAVVKGGGGARVIQIFHDYITLRGFTVDGLAGDSGKADGYRDKLIYVIGQKDHDGVNGLRILNMNIKNAGGECIRLRYYTSQNEIAYNTIQNCGKHDFVFDDGGKNGEGIYIGTAPEQRKDGKNPTSDNDESNANIIHHNTINTDGNECVDIKENSRYNIVEYNSCTGQKDPNSGGMDSRGGNNTFRYNDIFDNLGSGVRLGGDTVDVNINNDVYENTIKNNKAGGVKFQAKPQGKVCGNKMEGNEKGNSVGSYGDEFEPEKPCS